MAVKYECPKCGRRFAEWGAEKLGFKCPHDEWCPKDATGEIELVRLGTSDDKATRRPSLKRTVARKRAVAKSPVLDEDEALVPDVEEIEADEDEDETEDEDHGKDDLPDVEEHAEEKVDVVDEGGDEDDADAEADAEVTNDVGFEDGGGSRSGAGESDDTEGNWG